MSIKSNTHIIIKNEDIESYLSEEQKMQLENIICTIGAGRILDNKNGYNTYYICNTDEPYANDVLQVILQNESKG